MLAGARARLPGADALPARRAAQAARSARSPREAGLPVADKPESQDLCFLAGTGQARVPRPPRRPARARRATIVDRARPRGSAATAASTASRSASARASASAAQRAAVRAAQPTRAANTVVVGPREALATTRGRGPRRGPAPPGERGRRASSSATARAPLPCRAEAASDGTLRSSSTSPSTAPRPARPPCLLRGDVVVGHGVIA